MTECPIIKKQLNIKILNTKTKTKPIIMMGFKQLDYSLHQYAVFELLINSFDKEVLTMLDI